MSGTGNRKIILFSFTGTGASLGRRLCGKLEEADHICEAYAPEKYAQEGLWPMPADRAELIGGQWGRAAFLFIGAAGIAVRFIAPWVKDKYTDSPVLVLDEKGRYVIPLLSGHVGGAAALADEIARLTGGTAVHTTATDVQGKFAVDVFAKEHCLEITDRAAAKAISAAVLAGEKIALYIEESYRDMLPSQAEGKLPGEVILCGTREEADAYRYQVVVSGQLCGQRPDRAESEDLSGSVILRLKPLETAAGIGCRKGIAPELLEQGFLDVLRESGISIRQVKMIASIDLKKDEPALIRLAEKYDVPFVTYPADELRTVEEVSAGSEFVEKVTGVDNVCERAARLCARNRETGVDGTLIRGKCIREGMTAALAAYPARTAGKTGCAEADEKTTDILIFAGTTEGRLLAEYASAKGIGCYVSVVTEYGETLLRDLENATVLFARAATANIRAACAEAGKHLPVRYVRCLRQEEELCGGPECGGGTSEIIRVDSVQEAVEYLQQTTGNILITTGSKELELYTAIRDYRERCFARVLSAGPSVQESVRLGFEGSHLIAMQGPFSVEMNLALLHQTKAAYFVTKETGRAGGFEEKLEAAQKAGAVLVVIGRPKETGLSLDEVKELIARP